MKLGEWITHQQRLFWLLQLFGWSSWATTFYLGVLFWGGTKLSSYELYLATITSVGMVITSGLRVLYKFTWDSPSWVRLVTTLGGAYIAGLTWAVSRSIIFYHIAYPQLLEKWADKGGMQWTHYLDNATAAAWVMFVWSALYFGIKYYLISQEQQQRYLKALSMAHEAQLKMLRYQLNPHFLFNTLNAISTLILDKDTELANSMVTKLSRFLRYSLISEPMALVSVNEEVESLKLYLDIEKVRFADRLSLRFAIDPKAERALMPSLLLQPLVENAIKYAISQSINGGYIAVEASVDGDSLILTVADDGPGIDLKLPGPTGSGVGINNTRERLAQRYGDQQRFELLQTTPHGLTVRITLPLAYDEGASETAS